VLKRRDVFNRDVFNKENTMKVGWKNLNVGSEPIEAGVYLVKLLKWEIRKALSGNDKITWEAVITGPEGNPNVNRHLWDDISLTEQALWRLGWFVQEAGVNIKKLKDTDTHSAEFHQIMDVIVGREMFWNVVVDTYQGNTRNKVTEYLKAGKDEVDIDFNDIPDFIKNKKEVKSEEIAPF
jgi:hypothetical protein